MIAIIRRAGAGVLPSENRALNTAIRQVQRHVNEEAHPDQPRGTQEGEHCVPGDCRGGVQRMKSDTAAAGVVNGIGEKVIEVDEHRAEHDEPGTAPARAKEEPRHRPGDGGVEHEMSD